MQVVNPSREQRSVPPKRQVRGSQDVPVEEEEEDEREVEAALDDDAVGVEEEVATEEVDDVPQFTGLTRGSLASRTSQTLPSRPLLGSPGYRTN